MTERVLVDEQSKFGPGQKRIVSTDRGQIGVFNVNGEFYALPNRCIHQRGPLCEGKVLPDVEPEYDGPGTRVKEKYVDRKVIKCPWHGWEYDLETGALKGDDKISLPVFDVVVEDKNVYLEL